jgi:hypothetical protein
VVAVPLDVQLSDVDGYTVLASLAEADLSLLRSVVHGRMRAHRRPGME